MSVPAEWQGDWALDAAASRVGFRGRGFWGLASVPGHFKRFSGGLHVGDDAVSMSLRVETASVSTGIGLRDRHLRSREFLDARSHPEITFDADDARVTSSGLTATGPLQVRGKSVVLEVEVSLSREGAELVAVASCPVELGQFDIHTPLGMVRAEVELSIHARLRGSRGM